MVEKRLFDLVVAISGVAFFLPVLIMIGVLIVLEDGRPIFFIQHRLGKGLNPFRVVKFRSMHDGKITRTGRWIRATGLDEVLQFINVLNGSMSMVGPRPLTEEDAGRLGWSDVENPRFRVLPGITGLSQLYAGKGVRVSAFLEKRYVAEMSLGLDCKIIFLSFLVNVLGKKRVQRWLHRQRRHERMKRRAGEVFNRAC